MQRPRPAPFPLQYPVPPLDTNRRLSVVASVALCAVVRGGRAEGHAPPPVPGAATAGCAGGRTGTGRLAVPSTRSSWPLSPPAPAPARQPPSHLSNHQLTHPATHPPDHPPAPTFPSKAPRNGTSIPTVPTTADSRGSTSISTVDGERCRPTLLAAPRSGPSAAPRSRPPTLPPPPSGINTSVIEG